MCISVVLCVCYSWVAFEGPQFKENMYVLEEGDYYNSDAMGGVSADCTIQSLHTIGHVSERERERERREVNSTRE